MAYQLTASEIAQIQAAFQHWRPRILAYGTTTFSWDAAGRLIKIASGKGKLAITASYLYNGLGQRLIKGNPAPVNPRIASSSTRRVT